MTRDELIKRLSHQYFQSDQGALSLIIKAGYALVPLEPTEADRREWDGLDMYIASAENRGKLVERTRCVNVVCGYIVPDGEHLTDWTRAINDVLRQASDEIAAEIEKGES